MPEVRYLVRVPSLVPDRHAPQLQQGLPFVQSGGLESRRDERFVGKRGDDEASLLGRLAGNSQRRIFGSRSGNLATRSGSPQDQFSFNYANQLTGATVNGVVSTSTYNGDGLRMSHTANSQTANYVWDVNRSVPEILQDGTNTYVYGLGRISSTDGSGVQTYYDADGLGSTADLTNSSAAKTDGYTYDAFGAPTHTPGSSANTFQFTGQQTDADSRLQYLRRAVLRPGDRAVLVEGSVAHW